MTVRIPYDRGNSLWPWEFLMTVGFPYDRGNFLWPWELYFWLDFLQENRDEFVAVSCSRSRIFPFYFCFRCFVLCFRFSFSFSPFAFFGILFSCFSFLFWIARIIMCIVHKDWETSNLFAAAATGNGNEHKETHGNLFLKGRRGKGSVLLCPWTEVEGCQRGRCHS